MKRLAPLCLGIAILAAIAADADAQYPFGKNKVLYVPKDWKVIETAHVEIYYYPDELPVAEFVASLAETVYAEYAAFYDVTFRGRIPVILYGTHHDFKETNVTPYLVSESTAGFTEFVKGRIALPFLGSYPKLKKVFRHELAHEFMLQKLALVMKPHRRLNYTDPPLWFTEGLAEFLANRGLDSEAHMFLRDAVTSGLLYPLDNIWRIEGTFLMYKEGESVLHYIATNYGDAAIRVILEGWWKSDRFDLVLQKTIGVSLVELSDGWREYLERQYYPSIMARRKIDQLGEALVRGEPAFEVHPACDPRAGNDPRVFAVGYARGSIDILELAADKGGRGHEEIFVRGGQSNRFESIPTLRSRISVRGDTLLFVSKAGARDAIYVYDIRRKRVLNQCSIPEARILSSPTLSPEGSRIAFSAIDGRGKSDLFVYNLADSTHVRLTDDFFDDENPDWHPALNEIVFSSDRCDSSLANTSALYVIDAGTGEVTPLTAGGARDVDPKWLPDGDAVIFSSDRGGVPDIYILRDGLVTRQTNVLGGVFSPYPCDGGAAFLCASYGGGSFRCYRLPVRTDAPAARSPAPTCAGGAWEPSVPTDTSRVAHKDYRLKWGLDLIGATISVDPDLGSTGNGAQLYFSDMLGNHEVSLMVGSASDDFQDFFDWLNVSVTYANLSHRLNYVLGAFHLASYLGDFYNNIRYEKRYGVLGGVSYPFSAFERVGVTAVVKNVERDDDFAFLGLSSGTSWLVSNYVSFAYDNIVWYIGGPLSGRLLSAAFGKTWDFSGGRYASTTLSVDLRNYLTISDRVVLAQRVVSRNAWESDLQLFYLGGSWDLRGYEFHQFAGKRTLLVNTELRFPLIDRFALGFPIGAIEFPMFRGSLFFDAGKASGFIYDTGWLGSFGVGVEMNLGYMPVMRVDFCRTTDFEHVHRDIHVGFFLGFNY